MQPAGSGAIFESICNNKKVQEVLSKIEYTQLVDITNYCNNILDPLMFGYTHDNALHACMKACDKPTTSADQGGHFIVKKKNKFDLIPYNHVKKWNKLNQIKVSTTIFKCLVLIILQSNLFSPY